jgi:Zn finger protein HypA/HybF involved in hydrogenase expression
MPLSMVLVRVFSLLEKQHINTCFSVFTRTSILKWMVKKEISMAIVKCAICGEEVDSEFYGVKQCSNCGLWFCYKHQGQYKSQCIVCKEYALKNKYGR